MMEEGSTNEEETSGHQRLKPLLRTPMCATVSFTRKGVYYIEQYHRNTFVLANTDLIAVMCEDFVHGVRFVLHVYSDFDAKSAISLSRIPIATALNVKSLHANCSLRVNRSFCCWRLPFF